MSRTRLLATALISCLALVLTACGGGGGGGDSGTGAAGPSGEPVVGGEGRIITLSEPRGLDPATLSNAYAATALLGNALYGTLMTADDAGEIQYSMAESFTTDDGGTTFELKLRPDLVFSDGTPLTAEAVKFNWDRLKDPALGSTGRTEAVMVASTEAVDDRTLRVTLVSPMPKFAHSVIGSNLNWVASPAALQQGAQSFDDNPIGAGPYLLESWKRQAEITLVRNPRYWDAPKPYLDRLVLRSVTDSSQRFNTVLTGGADVAIDSSWVNISKAREAGLVTHTMQLGGGLFAALNTRRPPFDDIRARRAVAAALDLDALNLAAYNGAAQPVDTLFSESSPFYSDTPLRRTDRELAQRLFDELAAEGKPVSFAFTTTPTTENRALAENVQTQLSTFDNVKVEVRVLEVAEFSQLRSTYDFDAVITTAFFHDPEPRLSTVFAGDSASNLSGIDDPELNRALEIGRTSLSQEERRAAYQTVQERLAELVPAIFIIRVGPSAIAGRNVGGLKQYGIGSLLPEEIWIQK